MIDEFVQLKTAKKISRKQMLDVIDMGAEQLPLIAKNHKTLHTAADFFNGTPGFLITLQHALKQETNNNYAMAMGFIYEIEKAVEIQSKNDQNPQDAPEQVTAFETIIQAGTLCRQFDLLTRDKAHKTKRAWECKSICWDKASSDKLESQFLQQKELIHFLNKPNSKMNYRVSSKKPIPANWKKWFKDHQIEYSEDSL